MTIVLKVVLAIIACLGAIWSAIPLGGEPQATDKDLSSNEKAFLGCDIIGLCFMILVVLFALLMLCTPRGELAFSIICLVFSVIALVFFIAAIAMLFKFNPSFGLNTLPEHAWVFGALITSFYTAILSIPFFTDD
ncbi:unnamed protein product [Calicophoron daubneyi]|uniref:MARVEL domain-containing protein n=1 Tax=Calicophoron daubneyi TaxID=300641 RepID=A0AAV2TDJ5_CALDB